MALGYAGYREATELHLSVSDAMYASLQLFTVGGVIPADTPWQLDVARFLAPVAVVYAAVVAAVALLRDRAQRLLVAFWARGHIVIVGLGATGSLVAQGLRDRGHRVVALEVDPRSTRLAAARSAGVLVIAGDGTSAAHLRRAKITRARHVVVLTADDSRNLEVAAVARSVLLGTGRSATTVHVAIQRPDLWKELDRLRLTRPGRIVTTEYLNLDDRTALRMLAVAEEWHPHPIENVLIDGDTSVATRVIAHVVRRALLAGRRPRIHLAGTAEGAAAVYARLRSEEPWCDDVADVRLLPDEQMAAGEVPAGDLPSLALVCLVEADATAITRGIVLARHLPGTHVVAAVYRPRSEQTLDAAGDITAFLHLVPAKFEALGTELLDRSSVEIMARVRHEDYVAKERARGGSRATNPSLVPWDELADSLKESNRAFAQALSHTLTQLNAGVAPLTAALPAELPLSPDALESLARSEHERWASALESDGWRRTDGPKNADERRHPLLVPWEELPEAEREKDRDAIRVIPQMLARVGYALQFERSGRDDTG